MTIDDRARRLAEIRRDNAALLGENSTPLAVRLDCAFLIDELDRVTAELDQSNHWRTNYAAAVKDAEKERDRLAAKIARCEEYAQAVGLRDEPPAEGQWRQGYRAARDDIAHGLRKALADPQPEKESEA